MNKYSQYNNVSVPNHIKCNRCSIVKNKDAFSKTAQNDLASFMKTSHAFDAAKQGQVVCMVCAPNGQRWELKCMMCGETKEVNKWFSKVQRRKVENAKCWKCVEDDLNMNPAGEGSDPDSGSDYSDGCNSDSDDGFSDVTSRAEGMSLTDSTATYASRGASNLGSSGGVSLTGTSLSNSRAPSSVAGTTSTGYASSSTSQGRASISSFSTDKPNYSYTRENSTASTSTVGRAYAAPTKGNNNPESKWAKLRATPRKVEIDAIKVAERYDVDGEDE